MMKIINKNLAYVLLFSIAAFSCEQEKVIYDGPSLAQINGNGQGTLIINPAEDQMTTIEVGVTQTSSTDRKFTIAVGEGTTLAPEYYEISSLTGVIPAGEYTGSVNLTTFATTDFPASSDQLVIDLISVEDTEFVNAGDTSMVYGFIVACKFEPAISAGTYTITQDGFETSVGDLTFEVVEGPGPNQVTMINPFDHTNPDTGEGYDIIIDVDPVTGAATISRQAAWHCNPFGCAYGEGRVEGPGYVFSCLESMQFNLTHTVDAGGFGTFAFAAVKQ